MPDDRVEFLTVKEYAAMLRVHPETVKRWARAGQIAAVRVGQRGQWRIHAPACRDLPSVAANQ